jgi:hypothetical protein
MMKKAKEELKIFISGLSKIISPVFITVNLYSKRSAI